MGHNSARGCKPATPDKSSFKSSELDFESCRSRSSVELKSAENDSECGQSPEMSPGSALLKAFAGQLHLNN